MIYIYKDTDGKHKKKELKFTTDGTYHSLKQAGYDVKGQFGRHDYADTWIEFYDGDIDRTELRRRLDL